MNLNVYGGKCMRKLNKPKKYSDTNVEFYATEAVTPVNPVTPTNPTPAPGYNYGGSGGSKKSGSNGSSFADILAGLLKGK